MSGLAAFKLLKESQYAAKKQKAIKYWFEEGPAKIAADAKAAAEAKAVADAKAADEAAAKAKAAAIEQQAAKKLGEKAATEKAAAEMAAAEKAAAEMAAAEKAAADKAAPAKAISDGVDVALAVGALFGDAVKKGVKPVKKDVKAPPPPSAQLAPPPLPPLPPKPETELEYRKRISGDASVSAERAAEIASATSTAKRLFFSQAAAANPADTQQFKERAKFFEAEERKAAAFAKKQARATLPWPASLGLLPSHSLRLNVLHLRSSCNLLPPLE